MRKNSHFTIFAWPSKIFFASSSRKGNFFERKFHILCLILPYNIFLLLFMWSISNISQTLPKEVWESLLSNDDILFAAYLSWLPLSLAYMIIHRLFTKYFAQQYNDLNADVQTVVIHHAIEFVLLSLCFIPFTYLTMSLLFEEQSLAELESKFIPIATIMMLIVVTYLFELASRYRYPRPMLILHHLITYSLGLVTIGLKSTALLKVSTILVYFITFEAMTFFGLLCYRLFPSKRFTPTVIMGGMIMMGVSRPLQLVLIFGFLFMAWSDLVVWHAIFLIVATIVLTAIQFWSLGIHYGLWKRCLEKQGREARLPCILSWPLLIFPRNSKAFPGGRESQRDDDNYEDGKVPKKEVKEPEGLSSNRTLSAASEPTVVQ